MLSQFFSILGQKLGWISKELDDNRKEDKRKVMLG